MKLYKLIMITAIIILSASRIVRAENVTDPYTILNKHFETMGGLDAVKAEETVYAEGIVVIEGTGLQGPFKQWVAKPLFSREEVDLEVIRQLSGDNGQLSWIVDANGKLHIEKDEDALKRREVKKLLAEYDHLNPESQYFTLTFDGIEKVGTFECYVITMTNTINEDVKKDFYDTVQYSLVKTIDIHPDEEIHTIYTDYRDVNGVKHAFKETQEIFPIGQRVLVTISKYEINVPIASAVFEPPDYDVEDFHFTHGESAENIPFQFIENHISLLVNIGGKERLWILDTGAGKSVIDAQFAKELGLTLEGTMKGVGIGRIVEVSLTTLPAFSLDGLLIDKQNIAAIDVHPLLKRLLDIDVFGILGYDFLSRFTTKIDYAHNTISFYHPDRFDYTGTGVLMDAPLDHNTFVVPMAVDGTYSGKWLLDLGATGLTFHYPFAEDHNLLTLPGIDHIGFGAGGAFPSRISQFDSIEIAGFTIMNPLISIPREKGEGAFASKEKIGNIGNTLLRHFVLYLDYKKQQIILEKGDDFSTQFPRDKCGLQMVRTEDGAGYEVLFVADNTPAEKAGFKKGDIIKAINGISVLHFDGLVAIRNLFREEVGTQYRIGILRSGEPIELTTELQELW
ncbi:hypothetical protein AMJ52_02740 [candidate division TA06 bacterium DG_78]|uniref:PDZ domain-containing protein n=1 Tax=candidate division TA06 bacterium DG_78 TaxID=1703772 RepID=A0A0S7YGL1_UNCT6|nr:MAG: hypothetical protein AMJ52_02740 [candidate division TA06 bacterium DG_78]